LWSLSPAWFIPQPLKGLITFSERYQKGSVCSSGFRLLIWTNIQTTYLKVIL
jgi:hypothetical protein